MESFTPVLSMLGMLALIIAIFVGAYYVTRLVANGYLRTGFAGRQIEVLDRAQIGKEQNLMLVRTGSKVYLLATGPAGATKLDELDPALFPQTPAAAPAGNVSFGQVLAQALHPAKPGPQSKGDEP